MTEVLNNLWQDERPLISVGIVFFLVSAVFAVFILFDSTQILGINRWIKPIKFSISAGIFLLTVTVYLNYLQGFEKSKNVIAWGTLLIMVAEVSLIVMQAMRETTSHFNVAKPFDAMVFSTMGLLILTNTFLIVYLTAIYFQTEINLPSAVIWGMRLGLIVFILGSIQGGYMSSQTGHAVGVTDGGQGLPFLTWSTIAGDLRVAHFMGLHAFQVIPLFAVLTVFLGKQFSFIKPPIFTIIFAIVYFSAFTFVFAQALLGKPMINQKYLTKNIEQREIIK